MSRRSDKPTDKPTGKPPQGTDSGAAAHNVGFVDEIEEDVARLLLPSGAGEWSVYHVPKVLLPTKAREGQWIELEVKVVPAPAEHEAAALKARSQRGTDDGSDFSL